ncbi:putative clathrin assembly protein At5g57200 [Triticum dicoccoides]|uniref:putative clathrin assembly protein At5g57200 n=1 Tax=Triticum dicoccoides TaxID=85692 RepID=UPI0018918B87|nr:putative clathrin assembly protein At5g57200 [Triticum dicoccoides]
MGTASMQKSWRKACGAIKDSTTVSLAKVNSGRDHLKDLDVAVVKATSHVERPPKDRHLAKIVGARSRTEVSHCVHALARRLSNTSNWVVALKALVVIHRALREGDGGAFREELLSHGRRRGHALQMSSFKDDSGHLAWDCSAWVRTYALFLEERLECFAVLRYDVEAERLRAPAPAAEGQTPHTKAQSRTRGLGKDDLLEQLPALQQLLFRLVGCQPEGAAFGNYLIQYALALVLKESFKIYCAVNDGIINLVDVFFDMSKLDAIKAQDIYRRTGTLAKSLSEFYELCRGLELARNFQFPVLREPPASFLVTMEEYIREAPRAGHVANKTIEYRQLDPTADQEEQPPPEPPREATTQEPAAEEPMLEPEEEPHPAPELNDEPQPTTTTADFDLLGLHEVSSAAAEIEESNALALAIVAPGGGGSSASASPAVDMDGSSGWELALVAARTDMSSRSTEMKLAGGFDGLLLDSLYEDAARRQQQQQATYDDPAGDPFAASTSVAPPTGVQMSMMAQQQEMFGMPLPFQHAGAGASGSQANPFGDAYSAMLPQGQGTPFHGHGSGSLI